MKSSSRGDAESSRSPPSRLRPRESSAENVGPAPRVARKETLPRAGMKTIRSSSLSNNNNTIITNTSCSIPTCAPSSSTTPGAMTSATSGTSTSSGWQYTSNSRCLSCGKLGCNNCSIRVDPEAKRRKLESLRMNTPYERAKLLRATEELQQEEGRRRHKLYIHFLSLHEAMMGQQLMERQLILIGMKEEHLRELIVCDERMRRRRMTELSDCHSLLAALTRHEIEGRHKLAVMEQADRDALHYERVGSSSLVEQLSREATIRHTLILHEGAAREALHRQRIEGGAIIAANEAARLVCLDAFVESRDGLILDWREGLCRLQEVQHAHLTWIYHRIGAREELLRSYQHQQQQLLLLSSRVCEALKESMELAGEVVEQRRRKLHGALGELAGREVAERLAIAADMREAHHALHVWAKEEEEKVRRLEQRQEDDRGEELHTAMAMLLNISAEESDAFARIKEQELTERERRYQWMMSKEVARGEMMRLCLATVEGIREEEELRRRELCVELHRGEVEVVDQLHARDRRCRELAATEEVECAALRKAEHDARFRLVSAMAEHELLVRRWMTTKEAQVQELEQEEDGTRALLAKREETARDSIRWQRETEEEHALRHAKLQRSHIDEYHRACLDALEVIQREEMEAMGELKRRWARDGLHALATAHTREQVEACREERTQRAWIMQVEASERATATSTVLMALQLMREEFAQLAQAHRFDVEAEEQSLRSVVLQTEATAMELLSRSCMASAQAAREAEAERFQAELRARQVCLEEDARLYNDLEELPECEATMARPTNSSRLGGGGELMAMKVQLLQDALGMPSLVEEDVQPAAVELLIALVDAVGQRRAAMKAEGCAAEKRATEADAKCARQERLLRGEKEKKEAHATRARREAEDRERRVQHDQEEKQRGEHQLVVERKRLKAIHDQLSAQQLTLDGLKKNIQKQYQR